MKVALTWTAPPAVTVTPSPINASTPGFTVMVATEPPTLKSPALPWPTVAVTLGRFSVAVTFTEPPATTTDEPAMSASVSPPVAVGVSVPSTLRSLVLVAAVASEPGVDGSAPGTVVWLMPGTPPFNEMLLLTVDPTLSSCDKPLGSRPEPMLMTETVPLSETPAMLPENALELTLSVSLAVTSTSPAALTFELPTILAPTVLLTLMTSIPAPTPIVPAAVPLPTLSVTPTVSLA